MTAPKMNHTRSERSVPASSVKRNWASSLWWSKVPKAIPATKAAMKPFVPARTELE